MPPGDSPDEQHITRGPPQGDDEGSDDRQGQEVGEDAVAAAPVGALAQNGCQVAGLGAWFSSAYAFAVSKHLQRDTALWINQ